MLLSEAKQYSVLENVINILHGLLNENEDVSFYVNDNEIMDNTHLTINLHDIVSEDDSDTIVGQVERTIQKLTREEKSEFFKVQEKITNLVLNKYKINALKEFESLINNFGLTKVVTIKELRPSGMSHMFSLDLNINTDMLDAVSDELNATTFYMCDSLIMPCFNRMSRLLNKMSVEVYESLFQTIVTDFGKIAD